MADRFRINEPTVVFQEIDGELVLINFDNGHYHALNAAGYEVFDALRRGHSAGELVEAMLARYDAERGAIEASVRAFIELLHQHALIVPGRPDGEAPNGPAVRAAQGQQAAFEPPGLESYDDMDDFLLLNPIPRSLG